MWVPIAVWQLCNNCYTLVTYLLTCLNRCDWRHIRAFGILGLFEHITSVIRPICVLCLYSYIRDMFNQKYDSESAICTRVHSRRHSHYSATNRLADHACRKCIDIAGRHCYNVYTDRRVRIHWMTFYTADSLGFALSLRHVYNSPSITLAFRRLFRISRHAIFTPI